MTARNHAPHIGIIKFGALGDVLRTTSLLRPLRAQYPAANITWITRREALPLLEGNPFASRALAYHETLHHRLRDTRFDLLLSMDDEPAACALASALPAARLIGAYQRPDGVCTYTRSSAPWFRLGLLNRDPDGGLTQANDLKQRNHHTYLELWRQMLRLDHRSYPVAYHPVLVLSTAEYAAARRWAARRLPAHGVRIGLNPGAGLRWPAKCLPPVRAAALARLLHQRLGSRVLLYGGPDEHRSHRQVLRQAGTAVIDMGSHHPLRRFAAFVNLCDVMITSDSLALHVAQALGKPVVCFFGPTAAQEIELYGRGVALVPRSPCRCFYRSACMRRRSCVASLPLAQFVAGVRAALTTP